MKLFHGSIRKKLIILVLLATAPVLLLLIGNELLLRQKAMEEAKKDAAIYLKGFATIQERITDSTRTLLRTVASIPQIRLANVEQSKVILSTLLEANPIYSNVILVDIGGNVIAAGKNNEKAINLNFSDRKQFKEAIASKGFSSGEFVVGKSSQKAIFPFGMAVLNEQGQAIGAIIIGANLDHYASLFEQGPYLKRSFFGLCDYKGLRLYRYPENDGIFIGKPIKQKVYQAANTAAIPGSIVTIASDGLERVIVFEPLRLAKNETPYMYMFMGFEYGQVQNQANKVLIRAVTTVFLSLALVIAIAWYIGGRGIANRMVKLTNATKQFSNGEKNITSGIDYDDGEVGVLAESFDSMVSLLRKREMERDQILSKLSASEKRFREIIEDVSEISIQGYDRERKVTFWNSASEKLYGYKKEEVVGKKLEDLIIPLDMREEVIKLHTQWLEEGEKIPPGEMVLIDKNGNDVHVFSSHIMNETHHDIEMFCIDVDLSPLKRSEAEREVLVNRLKQSQKMEAIGTLAGGIAHDFNNILVPILGYSEMLKEEAENQDKINTDGLIQIHASALRAKELVRQILTFSRQEATDYQPVKIQQILDEVVKLLRSTIPRNIEIKQNINIECSAVSGDVTQLHQIIMNLATNAFHAMDDKGGELFIKLCEQEFTEDDAINISIPPGKSVCLTVADTGSGMPQELIDKIFDPFFTTKEKGKGTGMGLSVVHGIIENMSGSICVSSKLGEGSEFTIYWPVADSNYQPDSVVKESINSSTSGSEKILLVDDEDAVLHMTQKALQKKGYEVTAINSPIKALSIFRDAPNKFDLVMTDVSMPGMTGDDLAVELLNIRPELPIILCTGYSEKITPSLAEELGIKAIFIKPLMPRDLVSKVRTVLDQAIIS